MMEITLKETAATFIVKKSSDGIATTELLQGKTIAGELLPQLII